MTGAAAARRRAQRARRVRIQRDLSRPLAGVVALVALSMLGAALSGALPIRDVVVSGAARLSGSEIRTAAALDRVSVFRATARDAEARVLGLAAVKRARVTILLPDRALVDVEERRPSIVVSSAAGRVFADDGGALFTGGPAADGLATLEDETARRAVGDRLDPALVASTIAIATREPAYFGLPIDHIRLTNAYGLVAALRGGPELRLGTADQVDLKLEAARQIVLSRAGKHLDYVDVRNRENPVFFPLN